MAPTLEGVHKIQILIRDLLKEFLQKIFGEERVSGGPNFKLSFGEESYDLCVCVRILLRLIASRRCWAKRSRAENLRTDRQRDPCCTHKNESIKKRNAICGP